MSTSCETNKTKYLQAIIRKPQEGKTFICLENIKQSENTIHLVITMNTIKSNNQFFERANNKFEGKILVLNSKKNEESYQVKKIFDAGNQLKTNSKNIVIMCAHRVRFTQSITHLLNLLRSTKELRKKVIIHIDEAHAYIPAFRNEVNQMNNYELVEQIYCYSATPFRMWGDNSHEIFKKIYVVDVEKEFKIISSQEYFGVRDVELINMNPLSNTKFENLVHYSKNIPLSLLKKFEPHLIDEDKITWYSKEKTYFSLGYEYEYLCFIKYMLRYLNHNNFLKSGFFSYNFIPGYIRRITHYGVMDIIMNQYPDALVIVFNGIVCQGFIKRNDRFIELPLLDSNEPSNQIQDLVERYPERPTFVTGHICIGMSVTLINPELGNFDNTVLHFPQYFNRPDILYQMCRFLFNYISWDALEKRKIKKTRFITADLENYEICLEYEKQIDIINQQMKGSLRSQKEVRGNILVKNNPSPKISPYISIEKHIIQHNYQTFTVSNGKDEEVMRKVHEEWQKFRGKEIPLNSTLKKNNTGFYECSTTYGKKVYELETMEKYLQNLKWNSNLQLIKNQYKYSRLYVAYNNLKNSNNYTIFMKRLELKNNEEVNTYLPK